MIELPRKYPQVFERLGERAPKGVFFYGPQEQVRPSLPVLLLMRQMPISHISGPEIMGKFYGESEARLRGVFEDAQSHAPAIIFIDEIDLDRP